MDRLVGPDRMYVPFFYILNSTSTVPNCNRLPPAKKKDKEHLVPEAAISHKMPKMDFYYAHTIVLENKHLNDRSHSMVISIITDSIS